MNSSDAHDTTLVSRLVGVLPVACVFFIYDYVAYYLTFWVHSKDVIGFPAMFAEFGLLCFSGLLVTLAWFAAEKAILSVARMSGWDPLSLLTITSTLDIVATLDDLLGTRSRGLEGHSLLSAEDAQSRWIFSMPVGSNKFAVVHGNLKYVWDRERMINELYDVVADSSERKNLLAEKATLAKEMADALSSFVAERGRTNLGAAVAEFLVRTTRPALYR